MTKKKYQAPYTYHKKPVIDINDLEQMREWFDYDAETGELYYRITKGRWKMSTWKQMQADGSYYYKCYVNTTATYVHRVCWFMHYGQWPKGDLDHINRNKVDNRISNLREAGKSGNHWNRTVRKDTTVGYKGVSPWLYGRYYARIQITDENGKVTRMSLGTHATPAAAARAYNEAALQYHGKFAVLNTIRRATHMIREKDGQYEVTNKSGTKVLGTHKTKIDALAQLQAIEISKHKNDKGATQPKKETKKKKSDK